MGSRQGKYGCAEYDQSCGKHACLRYTQVCDIPCQIYCGGPLSPATGDRLVAAGVRLYCVYGGTEFGGVTHILDADYDHIGVAPKSPDEWQWMRFSDRCSVRWVPQDDGTYECCFMVGFPDHACDTA